MSDWQITLAFLVPLGAGYVIGWWPRRRPGICPCGHPYGCRTPFGACNRKIRVRNYVGGRRSGWKYAPCGCHDHAEAAAPSPLGDLLAEVKQP